MYIALDLFDLTGKLTDLQNQILRGIIALAVGFLLYLFNSWLNRRASRKSAFKKAIAEFKAAFTDEIIKLEKSHTSNLDNSPRVIIEKAATKHKNAAMELRHHLSKSQKAVFDALWSEYEGENKYDGVHDIAKAKRQLALDRIKKLTEFVDNLKP